MLYEMNSINVLIIVLALLISVFSITNIYYKNSGDVKLSIGDINMFIIHKDHREIPFHEPFYRYQIC